jgi:hypothetical protein
MLHPPQPLPMATQALRGALLLSLLIGSLSFFYQTFSIPALYYWSVWHHYWAIIEGGWQEFLVASKELWESAALQSFASQEAAAQSKKMVEMTQEPCRQFFQMSWSCLKNAFQLSFFSFIGGMSCFFAFAPFLKK